MKKALIGTILFSILFSSFALGAGNTPASKIVTLNIGNVVWVTLEDGNGNPVSYDPLGCANDAGTFALVADGNSEFDRIFTGLTLAKGTNSTVRIWVTGCYEHHNGKIRPTIDGVNVF